MSGCVTVDLLKPLQLQLRLTSLSQFTAGRENAIIDSAAALSCCISDEPGLNTWLELHDRIKYFCVSVGLLCVSVSGLICVNALGANKGLWVHTPMNLVLKHCRFVCSKA